MTTKTEMTLENVCFRYDGSKEAKECFGAFRDATKCLWSPQDGMIYGVVDNKPKIDFVVPIGFTEVSPSDYLLILSAPESQAHLLTEKESNDMAHVSEHKSAMEYLKEPSLKELSQPPVMEGREKIEKLYDEYLKDPSFLIQENTVLRENNKKLQSEVEQLKGLLRESKIFCGGSLQARIDNYLSK